MGNASARINPLAPLAAGPSGENSRTIFPKVCQLNLPEMTFNYPLPPLADP